MTVGGTGWKFGHYKTCYAQIGCITTISKLLGWGVVGGGGGGGGSWAQKPGGRESCSIVNFKKCSKHAAHTIHIPMPPFNSLCKGGLVSNALHANWVQRGPGLRCTANWGRVQAICLFKIQFGRLGIANHPCISLHSPDIPEQ